ncbi:RNA polymerase sigma factor [Rhizorhabdus argentea]|uniref:RNA polymerase sigma factor n=1 Tax=Rhizorhabdus argentea TaxID=1387174 RepID=UPI0030ED913E
MRERESSDVPLPGAEGDARRSAGLLSTHIAALRVYFRRRVKGEAVDDLVQDVLVSIQSRKSNAPIENAEAYLFTVARNTLARHRRTNNLEDSSVDEFMHHLRDPLPLPDRCVLGRQELDIAMRAIENMPARTRDVFLMHRFDEMTYAAIAARIGISVSAVEKHIMLALSILVVSTGRCR